MAIHDPIHDHRDKNERVVLTPTEARQGALGRPVLYVLVVGLLLAMLTWAAVEFWGNSIEPENPANTTQTTAPAADPAADNPNVVDDNPLPGVEREPAPAIVEPQPTGNQ